jgi:hypothetical protein
MEERTMAETSMSLQQILAVLRRYLNYAKGDGLERAELGFRGLSDAELDTEHGQSGRTRREILEGYRRQRREWEAVKAFVDSLE